LSGRFAIRFDARMGVRAESLEPAAHRSFDLESRVRVSLAWLEREAFVVAVAAIYGVVLLLAMPGMLVQDSWSTLASGREIALNGLPHHETLTVMAHGVRWVDQQWLAQLAFYELFRAGGYPLILLTHVALIASAFGLALVAARRRGGSVLAVFGVAVLCFFVAPWGWQLRAQSFAPLLFVAVLWLLVADGRSRSRRVFLVLPLLALWANLHGSVVLGAPLVMLYGAALMIDRRRGLRTGATLLALAPLSVLCSPYGLSLVDYYRHLLFDPPFGRLVNEWTAPTPGALTALFYVLAFVTVWAIGRRGAALTIFERLALLATLAAALHAARNIVWFGLAALVLLPVMVSEERPAARRGAHPAARTGLSVAFLGVLAAVLLVVATKPASWYTRLWPEQRAVAAVSAATRDPATRVFPTDRNADWLLWRVPELRGRVAYDIRFELNTETQVRQLQRFLERIGPRWQAAARGYHVLVIDREHHERLRRSLAAEPGLRQVYLDDDVAVLARGAEGR
jgi:hypothetical protein